MITNIYKAIGRSKPELCVFVDLAKAFDTVSHKLLLEKLEISGIRGITVELFQSYLTNLQQKVIIDDVTGQEITVIFSVPQGTVLEPVLFTIYE